MGENDNGKTYKILRKVQKLNMEVAKDPTSQQGVGQKIVTKTLVEEIGRSGSKRSTRGPYRDFDSPSPYAMADSKLALLNLSAVEDPAYTVDPNFQCSRNGVARVSDNLTLKQLQEECNLREQSRYVGNCTRNELLLILGRGSICISLSSAYIAYKDVLHLFDKERRALQLIVS